MRRGGTVKLVAALAAAAATLALAAGPAAAGVSPADATATSTATATADLTTDGGWSYFSDPRAVEVATPRRLLYAGWVNRLGSIVAGSYDPATQQVQTMTLHDRLQNDDHANPSVLALPDGRVTYFWSAHNGGFTYYRTTTVPGDIHSFGPLRTLPVRVAGDRLTTYTNPVMLPGEGNRLYLFWRSQYTHQAFATSDDLGETWSPARVLLEEPGQRPYVKYAAHGDTIGIAFTRSHPDEATTGIYFMSYWHDAFFRADGTAIGGMDDLPFAPAQTELVVDPAVLGSSAWIQDVAYGLDGNPVIAYVATGATHRYHYVRWDGTAWHDTVLTDAGPGIATNSREPSYSGGMALDHADPSTAYLSRRVGEHNVVEKWQTTDGGATFSSTAVDQDLTVDNLRPTVPEGLQPDDSHRVLWMSGSYRYFTDYTTGLAGVPTIAPTPETATVRIKVPASVREGTVAPVSARLFATSSGHPAVNVEVALFERRVGGQAWGRAGTARTDATGLVTFRFRVPRSTELQIDWPGDERWTPARALARITAIPPYALQR